jgi:arylsulfatase A-like enzyme
MPHRPLYATQRYVEQMPGAKWDGPIRTERDKLLPAVISELDHHVGRLMAHLKERGLDERTLVIFASDNGPAVGSAGPLRGRKGSMHEGGVRVPMIARWPGQIPAGRTCDAITSVMDVLPTLAGLAGANIADVEIDGRDIRPLMTGAGEGPVRELLLFYPSNEPRAARQGRWKLHTHGQGVQLYDLQADIGEQRNLAAEHPDVVKQLRAAMNAEAKRVAEGSRPVGTIRDPKPQTAN